MDDQVRVSVKVQTDEGKKTENNNDKCKTGDKKGVDCVQNVQQHPSNTHPSHPHTPKGYIHVLQA